MAAIGRKTIDALDPGLSPQTTCTAKDMIHYFELENKK